MNSVDAGACEAALTGDPANAAIPTVLREHQIVQALYDEIGGALHNAGHDPGSLTLTGALIAIWDHPDAEAAWRAGQDIFADCRIGETGDTEIPRF